MPSNGILLTSSWLFGSECANVIKSDSPWTFRRPDEFAVKRRKEACASVGKARATNPAESSSNDSA
jgi:hypothetical protein